MNNVIAYQVCMVKWDINLADGSSRQLKQYEQLEEPFGFSTDSTAPSVDTVRKREMLDKKLMELASSSKLSILMTGFLMYFMLGNTISIYSIFFLGQSLISSVGNLMKCNKIFEPYEKMVANISFYKRIYLALNLVLLGIPLYKMLTMGLLPVAPSDYIALVPQFSAKQVLSIARG